MKPSGVLVVEGPSLLLEISGSIYSCDNITTCSTCYIAKNTMSVDATVYSVDTNHPLGTHIDNNENITLLEVRAEDKGVIIDSRLDALYPVNLTLVAPWVILNKLATFNIKKMNITAVGTDGVVVINIAGTEAHFMPEIYVTAAQIIIGGDSWISELQVNATETRSGNCPVYMHKKSTLHIGTTKLTAMEKGGCVHLTNLETNSLEAQVGDLFIDGQIRANEVNATSIAHMVLTPDGVLNATSVSISSRKTVIAGRITTRSMQVNNGWEIDFTNSSNLVATNTELTSSSITLSGNITSKNILVNGFDKVGFTDSSQVVAEETSVSSRNARIAGNLTSRRLEINSTKGVVLEHSSQVMAKETRLTGGSVTIAGDNAMGDLYISSTKTPELEARPGILFVDPTGNVYGGCGLDIRPARPLNVEKAEIKATNGCIAIGNFLSNGTVSILSDTSISIDGKVAANGEMNVTAKGPIRLMHYGELSSTSGIRLSADFVDIKGQVSASYVKADGVRAFGFRDTSKVVAHDVQVKAPFVLLNGTTKIAGQLDIDAVRGLRANKLSAGSIKIKAQDVNATAIVATQGDLELDLPEWSLQDTVLKSNRTMRLRCAEPITNQVLMKAGGLEVWAPSFVNHAVVQVAGLGQFKLVQELNMTSGSTMTVGWVTVEGQDGKRIRQVICKGCEFKTTALNDRNFIRSTSVMCEINSYQKTENHYGQREYNGNSGGYSTTVHGYEEQAMWNGPFCQIQVGGFIELDVERLRIHLGSVQVRSVNFKDTVIENYSEKLEKYIIVSNYAFSQSPSRLVLGTLCNTNYAKDIVGCPSSGVVPLCHIALEDLNLITLEPKYQWRLQNQFGNLDHSRKSAFMHSMARYGTVRCAHIYTTVEAKNINVVDLGNGYSKIGKFIANFPSYMGAKESIVGTIKQGRENITIGGTPPAFPVASSSAQQPSAPWMTPEMQALMNAAPAKFDPSTLRVSTRMMTEEGQFVEPEVDLFTLLHKQGMRMPYVSPARFEVLKQIEPISMLAPSRVNDVLLIQYIVDIEDRIKAHIDTGASRDREFLNALGFPQIPVTMYYNPMTFDRLLSDMVFATIGRISEVDNAHLTATLMRNAIDEYNRLGKTFQIGQDLAAEQTAQLQKSMLWLVARDDCWDGVKMTKCLDWKLYLSRNDIADMVVGSMIEAGEADLTVLGDLWLGYFDAIKVKGKMTLNIKGHAIVVGSIDSGSGHIEASGNFLDIGRIKSEKDLAIKALGIAITTEIAANKGALTLEAREDLILHTLIAVSEIKGHGRHAVKSEVMSQAKATAGTKVSLKAGRDAILGAPQIKGDTVEVRAGNKVHVFSLELYNSLKISARRYYYERSELTHAKPSIEARSKEKITVGPTNPAGVSPATEPGVILSGAGGVATNGLSIDTDKTVRYESKGNISMTVPQEEYKELEIISRKRGGFAGAVGGNKITTKSRDESKPAEVGYKVGGVEIETPGNIEIGHSMVTPEVEFQRTGATSTSTVSILPSVHSVSQTHTVQKTGPTFKIGRGGIAFWQKKTTTQATSVTEVKPTILLLKAKDDDPTHTPKFATSGPGTFRLVSSRIEEYQETAGAQTRHAEITIDMEEIELISVPDSKLEHYSTEELFMGIGFTANKNEVSIKASVRASSFESTTVTQEHNARPGLSAGSVKLTASKMVDGGAVYTATNFTQRVTTLINQAATNSVAKTELSELIEVGVKLGIKFGAAGRLAGAAKTMTSQKGTPEGMINAGFAGLQAYMQIMKILSGQGLISAGAWVFAHYESSEMHSTTTQQIPTQVIAEDAEIEIEQWDLTGTRIETKTARIKVKSVNARPVQATHQYSQTQASFNAEIPLAGGGGAGIDVSYSKAHGHGEQFGNSAINAEQTLKFEVEGAANLQGMNIEAGIVQACFNSLLLESVQDTAESEQIGGGIGASTSDISSASASVGESSKRRVNKPASIIGKQKCTVIVTNELHVKGSTIGAEKGGEFKLEAGEVKVEHIDDHEEGYTVGVSVSSEAAAPTIGGKSGSGQTLGTLGEGEVKCTKAGGVCETDKANRDMEHTQTWTQHYDVDPITAYIPLQDIPDLPKNKDGSINWDQCISNVKGQFTKAFDDLGRAMGFDPKSEHKIDMPKTREEKEAAEKLKKEYEQAAEEAVEDEAFEDEFNKESDKQSKENKDRSKRQYDDGEDIKIEDEYDDAKPKAQSKQKASAKTKTDTKKPGQEAKTSRPESADKPASESKPAGIKNAKDRAIETSLKIAAKYAHKALMAYKEFVEKYPLLAEYGLSMLNIGFQTALAGPAGAFNAIRSEAIGHAAGHAIGAVTEEYIHEKTAALSQSLQAKYSMSAHEADSLATAAVGVTTIAGGAVAGAGTKAASKAFKKVLDGKAAGWAKQAAGTHTKRAGSWKLDGPDPYQEALKGGRHSGKLKDVLKLTDAQLARGIRSFDRQIAIHKDKIQNPAKYLDKSLSQKEVGYYTNNKWPKEIRMFEEQKYIIEKTLEMRKNA